MEPILRELPEALESARLLIRAPRPGDGRIVNEAIVESFDSLHPWLPWAREVPEVDETEAVIRRAVARWVERSDLLLLLFRKDDGALVGGSGLHHVDWTIPKFEVGYWGRTRFQGQGYVVEAVRAIAAFAFDALGARRVQIRCDALNERSRRVAERAGFVLEATMRNEGLTPRGEVRDTLQFALTDGERARLGG